MQEISAAMHLPRTDRIAKVLLLRIAVILFLLFISLWGSWVALRGYQSAVAAPALVICAAYLLFATLISSRVKSGLFGEVGFVFLGFSVAYSVIPALNFLIIDFEFPLDFDGLNFSVLNPLPSDIADHLWRHCLFIIMTMVGYIAGRGSDKKDFALRALPAIETWVIFSVVGVILGCMFAISMLSDPVEDYWSHYTRFDSLSWVTKRLVYVFLILKSGGYYVALTLMFSDFQRFKYVILLFVLSISTYELVYSFGARIEVLSILLATLCLYHFNVRNIQFRDAAFFLVFY